METIKVKIKSNGSQPFYRRPGDAGVDLVASMDVTIPPGHTVMIPTGMRLEIPEGVEAQIRPRSGMAWKTPLRVVNAPGTIDSSYRGEIMVLMQNTSERFYTDGAGVVKVMPDRPNNHYSCESEGNQKGWYDIKRGDRIAQMVFAPYLKAEFVQANSLSETERGEGGFGSTGVQ